MRNTADVTGVKPIAVLLQSISGVSAKNPLVAFYDIHRGKIEVFRNKNWNLLSSKNNLQSTKTGLQNILSTLHTGQFISVADHGHISRVTVDGSAANAFLITWKNITYRLGANATRPQLLVAWNRDLTHFFIYLYINNYFSYFEELDGPAVNIHNS
jgi:hypothetical protein